MEGDFNRLQMDQSSSANTMTVGITGDRNNYTSPTLTVPFLGTLPLNPPSSPAFSGAALAANVGGLGKGDLFQGGDFNSMTLTVEGDLNSFAMSQAGDSTIIGSITGNLNQAVVSQVSMNNMADFSQTGNGNNVGIMQ